MADNNAIVAEYHGLIEAATAELQQNLYAVDGQALALLMDKIIEAKRIGFYGVGREGLAMKGLTMRLFHMGLKAFFVGEMTAQAVGPGDVLLVSCGPGFFSTVSALSGEAQRAGATVVALTSQPPSPIQDFADVCIQVPATCLPPASLLGADPAHLHRTAGMGGKESSLLMGSSYELSLQLFFDIICVMLKKKLGVDDAVLKATHTNLE